MIDVLNTIQSFALTGASWLFVITVVIFFHEFGHFQVGRWCGVRVETFSIGFGPEIFGWNDRHGTRWKVSWIPLGGYVKFLGDANEASAPDPEAIEQMEADQRLYALHTKKLWERAAIVAAGPAANFILAFVIFTAVFMTAGRTVIPPVVGAVTPGSAAAEAGFMVDDLVRSVDGRPIETFNDMVRVISRTDTHVFTIEVQRGSQIVTLRAQPKMTARPDGFGGTESSPIIGVESKPGAEAVVRDSLFPAIYNAADQIQFMAGRSLLVMSQIVTGKQPADQLRGPLGIADISGKVAEMGFLALINLAGLISVSIGLINLFPIPVLDGGHLLYYACEAVLGRPLGVRAQRVGFNVGLVFVVGLMLFATFNDIVRFNLF